MDEDQLLALDLTSRLTFCEALEDRINSLPKTCSRLPALRQQLALENAQYRAALREASALAVLKHAQQLRRASLPL